jgi:DNA-binding NtrC family response regulator
MVFKDDTGGLTFKVSAQNKIVSIVDDDIDTTILFKGALRRIAGITIFTFTDPVLALHHFQDKGYAYVLVICDSKMPGLSGMDLLKNIKNLNRFVRTILITAFALDQELFMQYAKQKIINGFLQKPISLDDLLHEVNNQLLAYDLKRKNILPTD